MDLSNLKPAQGSVKASKRIGRGQGSGRGGTSTRGHKGAKSRSGYSQKIGFEGGQMPLYRRVPKYGFRNINRIEYRSINLDVIQALVSAKNVDAVDIDLLIESGLAFKACIGGIEHFSARDDARLPAGGCGGKKAQAAVLRGGGLCPCKGLSVVRIAHREIGV